MSYLVRIDKPRTKHLWRKAKEDWKDGDTVCHQYSTGGLNKANYKLVEESTLPTCTMCARKEAAYRGIKWKS